MRTIWVLAVLCGVLVIVVLCGPFGQISDAADASFGQIGRAVNAAIAYVGQVSGAANAYPCNNRYWTKPLAR